MAISSSTRTNSRRSSRRPDPCQRRLLSPPVWSAVSVSRLPSPVSRWRWFVGLARLGRGRQGVDQTRGFERARLVHPTPAPSVRGTSPSAIPKQAAQATAGGSAIAFGVADDECGQVWRLIRAGSGGSESIRVWPVGPKCRSLVRLRPKAVPEGDDKERQDETDEHEQWDHVPHTHRQDEARQRTRGHTLNRPRGGMPERLNGAVLKTAVVSEPPGVRIPLPPPIDCPIG